MIAYITQLIIYFEFLDLIFSAKIVYFTVKSLLLNRFPRGENFKKETLKPARL